MIELSKKVAPLELDNTLAKLDPVVTNITPVDGKVYNYIFISFRLISDGSGKGQYVAGTTWNFDVGIKDE